MEELWPDIGKYCIARGRRVDLMLVGKDAVPIDGIKLRDKASERLMTRSDLAAATGLAVDSIAKAINGKRNPTVLTLSKLVHALECSVTDLLLEDEPPG